MADSRISARVDWEGEDDKKKKEWMEHDAGTIGRRDLRRVTSSAIEAGDVSHGRLQTVFRPMVLVLVVRLIVRLVYCAQVPQQ